MPKSIEQASKQMQAYKLEDYKLNVIQGSLSDSTLVTHMLQNVASKTESSNQNLVEQVAEVQRLEDRVKDYTVYETLSGELRDEIKTLWPAVYSLSLSSVVESSMDSVATKKYVVAVAGCRQPLLGANRQRFQQWLKARAQTDSVRLIITR